MVASAKQIAFGGMDDPAEEAAEIESEYVVREALWSAMRQFVAGYVANGQRGYDAVAAALDRRWGVKGRPVSASALRSALHDAERNNFRGEWFLWFRAQDQDIAALLAGGVRAPKTPEERIADLEAELREALSHKLAEQVIRKARAR